MRCCVLPRAALAVSTLLYAEALMAAERDDLAAFAASYTAAWNSGDPSEVARHYAAGGVLTINGGVPSKGREEVAAAAKGFMDAFPDMVLSNPGNEVGDGRVIYHWRFIGSNTGPDGTGAAVDFSGSESWIFDNEGLILDSIGSFDDEDYQRQLGLR